MEGDYEIGTQLILELYDECLIGELVHADTNGTRIKLKNVFDFNEKSKPDPSPGIQTFYRNEIRSIRVFKNVECPRNSNNSSTADKEPKNATEEFTVIKSDLSLEKFNNIKQLIDDIQVLYQTDFQFHESIKNLLKCSTVAVCVKGANFGRQTPISTIAITNNINIYIYDIKSIGYFPKELGRVFESKCTKKIIHESRSVADNLKFCHQIELNLVFDTMVVNASINGSHSPIDFIECTSKYLNLPSNWTVESNLNWSVRPLTDLHKQQLGHTVAYLFELFEFQTNLLLAPLFNGVKRYMDSLRNIQDYTDNAEEIRYKKNEIKEIPRMELDVSDTIEALISNTKKFFFDE